MSQDGSFLYPARGHLLGCGADGSDEPLGRRWLAELAAVFGEFEGNMRGPSENAESQFEVTSWDRSL